MGPIEAAQVQRRKELAVRLGKIPGGNVKRYGNHVALTSGEEPQTSRSSNSVVVIPITEHVEPTSVPVTTTKSLEEARDELWALFSRVESALNGGRPSIESIVRTVAGHYGVTIADINSRRRTRDIVKPRQVAMYLAKELTGKSYPKVGRRMGGKDHTSVLHAYNRVQHEMQTDDLFRAEVEILRGLLTTKPAGAGQ